MTTARVTSGGSGHAAGGGSIYYAWRSDNIRQALGYALDEPREYTGMHQRAVVSGGEQVYFSSASGPVYQFTNGQAWSLLVPH